MVLGKLGQCRPVYGDYDCGVGVADREGLGLDMVQRHRPKGIWFSRWTVGSTQE